MVITKENTEVDHLTPGHIIHFINSYPGYGYTAGGAERHLHQLNESLAAQYSDLYKTLVYVAQPPETADPNYTQAAEVIANPYLFDFLRYLYAHQKEIDILSLSNLHVAKRPQYFLPLRAFWHKPIIMRVTSTRPMNRLLEHPTISRLYTDHVTVFVSQSDELTQQLRQLGIDYRRIHEINNGVNTSFFAKPKSSEEKSAIRQQLLPHLPTDGLVYINVGRVSKPDKRSDELLDAWEASELYKDGHSLILAGPLDRQDMTPQMRARYLKFTQNKRYQTVWTDTLPVTGVKSYLQASDIFVTASTNEGFSNAALEAMACGLPVIGRYGVSGHSKIIQDGVTGLYFDDTSSLRDILRTATDNSLRDRMAAQAYDLVRHNFTIEQTADQYHKLYQSLL